MADNVDAEDANDQNDIGAQAQDGPTAGQPPKKRRRRQQIQGVLPSRPRKSLTAYSMFLKDYFRERVLAAGVGGGPLPTAKTAMLDVSAQWKALDEERKAFYEQQCADDKARYQREIKVWKTQRNFIKRPPSAYALFLKEAWDAEKAAGRNPKVTEMGKIASTRWKVLTPEARGPYQAQYEALKAQKDVRLRELAAGNVSMNAEGVMQINEVDPPPPVENENNNEEDDEVDEIDID